MMKRLVIAVVALLTLGSLVAAGEVPGEQMITFGTLNWTRNSVCEDPVNGGYLQYYLSSSCADCGQRVFLIGDLTRGALGQQVWAEGILYRTNNCLVLDVQTARLCSDGKVPPSFQSFAP
jgi:hypothetical protein